MLILVNSKAKKSPKRPRHHCRERGHCGIKTAFIYLNLFTAIISCDSPGKPSGDHRETVEMTLQS